MAHRELTQSELARRVGVSQASIYRLVAGDAYGSKHLHKIARELGTTPAYLSGETDDPDEGAPPPPPEPLYQLVTMPVALPSEGALTAMFEALLLASPRLHGAELAQELARRLPRSLSIARGALIAPASDAHDTHEDDDDILASADPEPRRARRG